MTYHLVFDTTDPKSPRFIELEDSTGHSISAGEWRERKDGYVELVLPAPAGWQDIATAPMDWSNIILFDPERELSVFEGYYSMKDGGFDCWMEDKGPISEKAFPTHWMPLPSPPKPLSYEGEQQ